MNKVLRANSLSGAVAASVAFFGVDYDFAVFELHCVLLANLDTITDTTAAALAFAAFETRFN